MKHTFKTLCLGLLLVACQDTTKPQEHDSATETPKDSIPQEQPLTIDTTKDSIPQEQIDTSNLEESDADSLPVAIKDSIPVDLKWIAVPDTSAYSVQSYQQLPYGLQVKPTTSLVFSVQSENVGCNTEGFSAEWSLVPTNGMELEYIVDCSCLKIYPGITSCQYVIPQGHQLSNEIRLQHIPPGSTEPDSLQLYFIHSI